MVSPVVVSSASTSSVGAADRLAYWEQHNAQALVGLTCSTHAPEGLVAREVNLDLGAFRVADISGNRHVIERAPAMVRRCPKDAVFLSILLSGEAFFYHAGGCLALTAGDVVVYDTDRPYLFGFGSDMRQLLVDVPWLSWVERCGSARLERPLRLGGSGRDATVARTLRTVLSATVSRPERAPDGVAEQVLDLVQLGVTGNATGAGRFLAAKLYVAEHLQDPGLTTEEVARAVGVTPRHLNRAFAEVGTTVAHYVLDSRLDAAHADLTAPYLARDRIADIAVRWAFASQAHFARVFRTRFGRTPTEVRRGALVGVGA